MDTLFRILLGDNKQLFASGDQLEGVAHRQRLAMGIVESYLPAYTFYKGSGYWGGTHEPTHIFEYLGTITDDVKVLACAEMLRRKFKQEEVLVTRQDITIQIVREGWKELNEIQNN